MRSGRQAFWILTLAAAATAAWSAARPWLPRASFAEAPAQANQIRLQAWLLDPPRPVVLAGTSIAARLLPEYFQGTPTPEISVLALEGLSPDTSLALALERPQAPRLVLLEAHRLDKPSDRRDAEALAADRDPGLAAARWAPGLRADVRPSSMVYAWLKSLRPSRGLAERPSAGGLPPQASAEGWKSRFAARIAALKARGSQVALVRLPAGRENPESAAGPSPVDQLGAEWGVAVVDVLREAERRGLAMAYTDGLHLDPPSARASAQLLAELAAPLLSGARGGPAPAAR